MKGNGENDGAFLLMAAYLQPMDGEVLGYVKELSSTR